MLGLCRITCRLSDVCMQDVCGHAAGCLSIYQAFLLAVCGKHVSFLHNARRRYVGLLEAVCLMYAKCRSAFC